MYVWGFSETEKIAERDGIELLPDLSEDVLCEDLLIVDTEEVYSAAMDEWWSGFISDMFL